MSEILAETKPDRTTGPAGTFVNASGRAFAIQGLAPMLPEKIRLGLEAEWKRAGQALPEEPPKPLYAATNAAGETIQLPHDETTLESEEDRAAWAAYQAALAAYRGELARFEAEVNKRLLRACCLCVQVDPGEEREWQEELAFLGVEIPESRIERKLLYVETQVFKALIDMPRLTTAVMALSGLADEEMAQAAEAAFRAAVDAEREKPAAVGAERAGG